MNLDIPLLKFCVAMLTLAVCIEAFLIGNLCDKVRRLEKAHYPKVELYRVFPEEKKWTTA